MDALNPKSILVVQIGKIGDMILSTPLFAELKKLYPGSNLTVLSGRENSIIAANNFNVDKVICYTKKLSDSISMIKKLYGKIDLWIDCKNNYSRTSSLLLKLLRPRFSLGFNFGKKIFDVSLNEFMLGNHAVNINLSPVNYLSGIKEMLYIKPDFNIPGNIILKFKNAFTDENKLNLLINISAGNPSRYFQKEKWAEIINSLNKYFKLNLYLIGIEKDKSLIEYILNNSDTGNLKYIETENILEASALIKGCDFVITPDTAIVHVCSVFNKPVIAFYPDIKWNYEKFKPLSEINEVIFSENENSLQGISNEKIIEKTKGMIERISGNAESRTRVRKEDH